jgi:uncharacterized membrane protein YbaN (DUF454 family)
MGEPSSAARTVDDDAADGRSVPVGSRLSRLPWLLLGLLCVALGSLGTVVPGLPTTVFFIVAAWSFARSSPRLEAWVLGLPGVGAMVRDHREGLGMPRHAKILAVTAIVVAVTASAALGLSSIIGRLLVIAAGAVGVGWVLLRVPTRETVLAERAEAAPPSEDDHRS